MSTTRVVGIVLAIIGVAITIRHLVFAIFDRIPEKYHSHQAIVATGLVLAIGGLMLLGTDKQR